MTAMGLRRARVHWYPVTISVPTVLYAHAGRLTFALYLWPWIDDDEGWRGEDGKRQWRPWRPRRGGWPVDWRDQRRLDDPTKRVYVRPIFYWLSVGPLHVRYFRQLPGA